MLTIPSQITKVEIASDGGRKLVIHTNELEAITKAELMNWHNKLGWLVLSPTDAVAEEDIPEEQIEFEGQKPLSERLRNVLFQLHEAQGGKPEDFEGFRVKIM